MLILAACDYSHSIDTDLVSDVKFRPKSGATRKLETGDAEFQDLVRYLESNRDGWDRYNGIIPNVDTVFSTDQFVLYIGDDSVFLLERGEKVLFKNLNSTQQR